MLMKGYDGMNELLKALRPVKNRIRLGRLWRGAATGLAAGAAAALVLLAVTTFVPLEGRWWIAGAAVAGGALLGAVINALRPVDSREAARAADRCGLRERTVTALEMADRPPADGKAAELAAAQRQDACAHLQALDARKIRLQAPKKRLLAAAALLVLCAGTLLIPGGGDRIVSERKILQEKTARMAEEIDEAEAAEEAGKTEKEKAELRKLTADLKRELEDSRDDVDALVAVDKAESRLEEIRQKTAGDAVSELADALRDAGMDAAAQALENGDAAEMSAALSEINTDELKEAAKGLSGEAQEMAEQMAQAAQQGEMSDAQMQAMQSGSSQASAMQQALAQMKAALGAAQGASSQQQQSSNSNSSGSGSGGSGNQGQNAAGAGSGTTNEEEQGGGGGNKSSASRGNRPPEYKEGEYETIYDPEKVNTASRDVMTEQQQLGKDSVQIETGPGKGNLEGNVPYRQVIGEYAETEAQAAESAHLTREQKEWVDEYFRQLTDE